MGVGGFFKKLGGGLAGIAPTLAGAAVSFVPGGGVATALGRIAVGKVADSLGVDLEGVSEAEREGVISAALETATPEQLAALKKADQEFALEVKQLELDRVKIDAADRKDARTFFSSTTTQLAWVNTLGFFSLAGFMIYHLVVDTIVLSTAANSLIFTLLGYVAANYNQVTSYFFGSSEAADDTTKAMSSQTDQRWERKDLLR